MSSYWFGKGKHQAEFKRLRCLLGSNTPHGALIKTAHKLYRWHHVEMKVSEKDIKTFVGFIDLLPNNVRRDAMIFAKGMATLPECNRVMDHVVEWVSKVENAWKGVVA